MVAIAAKSLNFRGQKAFHDNLVTLQKQYGEGNGGSAIQQLHGQLASFMKTIMAASLTDKERHAIVKTLLKNAARTKHFHYEEAEQLAMAIASVLADGTPQKKQQNHLNALMDTLENSERFDSNTFQHKAQQFLSLY